MQTFEQKPLQEAVIITEAIILAGGLGTRLREVVPDLPKCMAPVCGRPFLFYVINYLRSQGIEKFIFSLGYKHEVIEKYLNEQFSTLNYECVIENEPLGTGGAIQLACKKITCKNALIVNGDTLFKADVRSLALLQEQMNAHCTLAVKPMKNFDRYGTVTIEPDGRISEFKEKQFYQNGYINAGVYILEVSSFLQQRWPLKFSFEKDYLEKMNSRLFADPQDGYFIDIGIPEDYKRAQDELLHPQLSLKTTDKTWTLFLDRDGVINHEKKNDYIRTPEEFVFYEGVTQAIKIFTEKFGRIIVVSNQRGVGRGLMSEESLVSVHSKMKIAIEAAGGRIDAVYYCTSADDKHPDRKPNPGMAFRAKSDFPEIDFSKTIMAGNKLSDMLFGRNAGIYTVFLATTHPETPFPHPDIDARFISLTDFANAL